MTLVLSTLAGVVAFLVLRRLALGYPKPESRYSGLARREVAFVKAVAEATFPSGGSIPVSGLDADIPGYIDHYFKVLPSSQRRQIRLLIALFEHATAVFPATGRGRFRRFSALTPEQRICVLRNWSESRFYVRRLLFTALRAVVTFGYLADKGVLRHLGLAPLDFDSPICEADLLYPEVGQLPGSISYSRADLTPPSSGEPLDIRGPLHPDYVEHAS